MKKHIQYLFERYEAIPSDEYSTQLRKAISIAELLHDEYAMAELVKIRDGHSSLTTVPLHVLALLVDPSRRSATNHNVNISGIPTSKQRDGRLDLERVDLKVWQIEAMLFALSCQINRLVVRMVSTTRYGGVTAVASTEQAWPEELMHGTSSDLYWE